MGLAAGARLGAYEILGPLGAGGMGEVYRARDTKLNRDVAIKILPDAVAADLAAQARFEREAQAVAALSHPNILGIFDFGVDGGTPYAVTELLEGGTLRERLAEGAIPPRKAIEYTAQIATGLAAAHERGITDRDLKPENVFLTRDGRVKILDFGLAKVGAGASSSAGASMEATFHVTSPGTVLGTVGYMSPEQVRGRTVDHRSDIFSLGAVLFEMLAGERAFTGESAFETMNAILKEDPPELTRAHAMLPPALDRIVRRCLEKNPDERFQSARDLAFALDAIGGSSAKVDAAAAVAARHRPRLRLIAMAALAVALVTIGFASGWVVGRLRGMSASSSQPTFHRLTFRRGWISGARFAPDGQTVVYGAQWDGNPPDVYITGKGSPESPALGLHGHFLGISNTGEITVQIRPHMIDSQSGSLANQIGVLAQAPMNGGAPREIQDSVRYADWDAQAQHFAVVRRAGGKWRLESPVGRLIYESSFLILGPRVSSRDGSIAFFEGSGFGDYSVNVVDREGHKTTLSSGYSDWWRLAWSPGGREVWFGASESGRSNPIYAVDLTGRRRTLLRIPGAVNIDDVAPDGRMLIERVSPTSTMFSLGPDARTERDVSWHDYSVPTDISDDGRTIVFSEFGDAGGRRGTVYLRKTDGSAATALGEGNFGSLSPDGTLVAAVGLPKDIFILPTGAGQSRRLTQSRFESVSRVTWFPDGRRLLLAAREPGKDRRLYAQALNGEEPRAIAPENFDVPSMGKPISPDGHHVAVIDSNGIVAISTLDGGPIVPVRGVEAQEVPIGWSADGRSIYVLRRGELPAQLTRVDVGTGSRKVWKKVMPTDPAGVGGISFMVITPDGLSYAYSYERILKELYLVEGVK